MGKELDFLQAFADINRIKVEPIINKAFQFELPLTMEQLKSASEYFIKIKNHLEDIESKLDKDENMEIIYYNPNGEQVSVREIGYDNPNMIVLKGIDTLSNECTLLVHMQSLNLIVKKIKKTDEEHRPIGFIIYEDKK